MKKEEIEISTENRKLEIKSNIPYLESYGFKIYRLQDERAESEFLLYDIDRKTYSLFSQSRLISILLTLLRDINVDPLIKGITEMKMDPKSTKPKDVVSIWVNEEVELISDICFKPSEERIIQKKNKKYFNSFSFLETLKRDKYKVENYTYEQFSEDAPYHHRLLMNLHNNDILGIQDTLYKLSAKLQYPEIKIQDAIVFYPGEGAGKGIFYKYIIMPLFQQYSKKILMKKLNNDFNGFLKDSLVLVIEEGKRDKELVETLKELITEPQILINEKGKPQKEEEIYFLTFVFSNNMNPIDLGKRRGTFHLTHSLGKTDLEAQEIGAEICENLPKETGYLLKYLHSLDIDIEKAHRPMHTKAKEKVIDLNKSVIELFYDHIMNFPELESAFKDLQNQITGKEEYHLQLQYYNPSNGKEGYYIMKEKFKEAYNNFCKIEGLNANIIRHNKDIVQLWALMRIPENSHQRIIIREGLHEGRRMDHIFADDVKKHYDQFEGTEQ